MRDTFYVTTPIYYVNDVPHIGHLYTTVAADTLVRYHRSAGREVFFLTGTDEHGQNIEEEARRRGVTPEELTRDIAARWRETWTQAKIEFSDFIRTTEARHQKVVQALWRRLRAAGDIYLGEYEGLYCVRCEEFYTESQAEGGRCPTHQRPLEMQKEESYFFRLSRYENRLLQHYAANPGFIRPENRYNEIVSFVRGGLRDLSVSRRRLTWGVPVPDDPRHVIWVWLDALTNYVSALGGFEDEAPLYRKFWPADVHLVGKDIVRFHAVYWPAFLMSAGLEPPRQVFVHGWWTVEGQKISKSLGNAVRPGELFARYGVDATRYFLLREFPFGGDGDFSSAAVVARYNGELANDLGNLLSRTVTMSARYLGGKVPAPSPGGALADAAAKAVAEHARATSELSFSRACEAVFALVRAGNKLIDENAPWALHKSGNQARLGEVLGAVCEALRVAGALLAPLMPAKMSELRTQLGVPEPAFQIAGLAYGSWPGPFRVSPGAPLFPRLSAIKEAILDDLSREVADSVEERSGGLGTRRQPLNLVQKVADTVQVTHTAAVAVPAADSKPEVSYEDFGKLDLRVGRVKHAERIPKSEKLLRLVVDIGEDRQVVAGIGKRFAPEDLVGRRVVVVANLKPIKLMGVESRGMVLAAGGDADLELVSVPDGVAPGARVK